MSAPGPDAPVVVGVDGSADALGAVRWAAAEASRQRCPLHLVHASGWSSEDHPAPSTPLRTVGESAEERSAQWLRHATSAAVCAAPTILVVPRQIAGDAARVLIAESRNARQVVVAGRGLDRSDDRPLGATVLHLAQHAACPLVVVRADAAGDPGGPVVVGMDGSAASRDALRFALEHAARAQVPVVAVHAWSDVGIAEDGGPWRSMDWSAARSEAQRLITTQLAGWGGSYPGVDVRPVVTQDRPVRGLLAAAQHARLLVVGSRGRGGFEGILLGSVSQALAQIAPCPIAIVRH